MDISVVVPVYNAELYLAEALDSLVKQDTEIAEIIVIDDGSSDASAQIAKAYSQVKYHYIDNSGPAVARNKGIDCSRHELVAFHDADDICESTRFTRQLEALQQSSNAEFCLCYLQNFVQKGCEVPPERLTEVLLAPRQGFISAGLFRKRVFDSVGLFDRSYRNGEDIEWLYRAQKKRIESVIIEDVLVRRRLHSNNLAHEFKQGHQNLFRMIRKQQNPQGDES